ncbi:MAG: hypothetical protein ACXVCP_15080 [Bdellovibrio sp.]
MSLVRKSLGAILSLSFLFSFGANAQMRDGGDRIRILESRVQQLEDIIYNMNLRLSNLENAGRPSPYPQPNPTGSVCMLTDTGYNKVFLGKGPVQLAAEAEARQNCGKAVNSSYCQSEVKCNDPQQDRYTHYAFCVLIDTGYNKTFKGEANTLIEAEYNTRKACSESVNSSYCVGAIRCEAR